MKGHYHLQLEHLGQTGLKITSKNSTILIDPYLSNSVQLKEGDDLIRNIPIPYAPEQITNIEWVLITHDHLDHCDPHTLPLIAKGNPICKFFGPPAVRKKLEKWGINKQNIYSPSYEWYELTNDIWIHAVPAAHPNLIKDEKGEYQAIGWMIKSHEKKIYVAGDTSLCEELISTLNRFKPIDCALLPVNEDNFFRRRRGIVGNMSIREAFGLAEELSINQVAPVHWDMFTINSTSQGEIDAVYNAYSWNFLLKKVEDLVL